MPTIDPTIVRRSATLRGDYGTGFRYGYYMGTKNLAQAVGITTGVGLIYTLAQMAPTRKWLYSLKPPGSGPSAEVMERGWFRLVTYGKSPSCEVVTEVRGGEPGYSETAKMLSESALCLAEDRAEIPGAGGLLTPASAFGEVLQKRLEMAGILFTHLPSPGSAK